MVTVQLPELYVDYVEILITKEISVFIDVILTLNVKETLSYFRLSILPVRYLPIQFPISPVHYSVANTHRVPILELWSFLQELKTWMTAQNLFQQRLKII